MATADNAILDGCGAVHMPALHVLRRYWQSLASYTSQESYCVCVCVKHRNLCSLQRALEDGLFSIEDEDGLSRPNMTAVLVAAKQVRISA